MSYGFGQAFNPGPSIVNTSGYASLVGANMANDPVWNVDQELLAVNNWPTESAADASQALQLFDSTLLAGANGPIAPSSGGSSGSVAATTTNWMTVGGILLALALGVALVK